MTGRKQINNTRNREIKALKWHRDNNFRDLSAPLTLIQEMENRIRKEINIHRTNSRFNTLSTIQDRMVNEPEKFRGIVNGSSSWQKCARVEGLPEHLPVEVVVHFNTPHRIHLVIDQVWDEWSDYNNHLDLVKHHPLYPNEEGLFNMGKNFDKTTGKRRT